MKKTNYFIIALLSLFILITQVNAERKTILIEGNDDEYANRVVLNDDGSFVVVGEFISTDIEGLKSNGNYDAYIIKYDKTGEVEWMKNYGGEDYDYFTELIQTSDNGYIAVGQTCSSDITGITLIGSCDALVVKFDAKGNVLWQKNFGTTGEDKFNIITKAQDGTYILGGATNYLEYGWQIICDGYIVKIDEQANVKLQQKVPTKDITFVIENSKGQYYVGDYTQQSQLRLFDKDFTLLWSTNNHDYTYVNDAVLLEDDSIVIVGTGSYTENVRTAYISKYNTDGTLIWTQSYGSEYDAFNKIDIDEKGNFIVAGGKVSNINEKDLNTAVVVRYDKEGKFLKEEVFQGKDATWFYGLQHLNDEAYVYVGTSYVSGTYYQDNIYIVYNTDYYIYDIFSKVEGKGTIEVIETSSAGEKITFKVTPEEGYVLNVIKVTDENGNIVEFKDYTFTMPRADVTIEVKFDKIEESKNPETADIFVIYFVITALVSTILLLSSKKKLDWMKKESF